MLKINRIEQIQTPEVANLVKELQNVAVWSQNPEIGKKILEKLIAQLVALDTRGLYFKDKITYIGRDLTRNFPALIEALLYPLVESGFIQIDRLNKQHPVLFIHHNQHDKVIEATRHLTEPYAAFEKVNINNPLLHAHFDTVDFSGNHGKNVPIKLKQSDLVIGRGTNDMKGQIAMLIMLLYKLKFVDCSNFFIVLGSNEEHGITEDEVIFERLQAPVSFDLEPTGFHSGVLANKFGPANAFVAKLPKRQNYDDILNQISYDLGYSFYDRTGEKLSIQITMEGSYLYVKILNFITPENKTILQSIIYDFFKYRYGIAKEKLKMCFAPEYLAFESEIDKPVLDQVLASIEETSLPAKEYPTHPEHISEYIAGENARIGEIAGFFATQLSTAARNKKNVLIGSVAEAKPRHSSVEAVSTNDLWNFMYFLENFLINFDCEG